MLEVEIKRIAVPGQPGQKKVYETTSQFKKAGRRHVMPVTTGSVK
jgi:hypothetical protein